MVNPNLLESNKNNDIDNSQQISNFHKEKSKDEDTNHIDSNTIECNNSTECKVNELTSNVNNNMEHFCEKNKDLDISDLDFITNFQKGNNIVKHTVLTNDNSNNVINLRTIPLDLSLPNNVSETTKNTPSNEVQSNIFQTENQDFTTSDQISGSKPNSNPLSFVNDDFESFLSDNVEVETTNMINTKSVLEDVDITNDSVNYNVHNEMLTNCNNNIDATNSSHFDNSFSVNNDSKSNEVIKDLENVTTNNNPSSLEHNSIEVTGLIDSPNTEYEIKKIVKGTESESNNNISESSSEVIKSTVSEITENQIEEIENNKTSVLPMIESEENFEQVSKDNTNLEKIVNETDILPFTNENIENYEINLARSNLEYTSKLGSKDVQFNSSDVPNDVENKPEPIIASSNANYVPENIPNEQNEFEVKLDKTVTINKTQDSKSDGFKEKPLKEILLCDKDEENTERMREPVKNDIASQIKETSSRDSTQVQQNSKNNLVEKVNKTELTNNFLKDKINNSLKLVMDSSNELIESKQLLSKNNTIQKVNNLFSTFSKNYNNFTNKKENKFMDSSIQSENETSCPVSNFSLTKDINETKSSLQVNDCTIKKTGNQQSNSHVINEHSNKSNIEILNHNPPSAITVENHSANSQVVIYNTSLSQIHKIDSESIMNNLSTKSEDQRNETNNLIETDNTGNIRNSTDVKLINETNAVIRGNVSVNNETGSIKINDTDEKLERIKDGFVLNSNLIHTVRNAPHVNKSISLTTSPVKSNRHDINDEMYLLRETNIRLLGEISWLEEEKNKIKKDMRTYVEETELYKNSMSQQVLQYEQHKEQTRIQHEAETASFQNIKKDLESKLEKLKKDYEVANKEKEASVMRYVVSESEVINLKKDKEQMEKKWKDAVKEKENVVNKLKVLSSEKSRLTQLYDDKCTEYNVLQRSLDKVTDEVTGKDIKIKWTQSKLDKEIENNKQLTEKLQTVEDIKVQKQEEQTRLKFSEDSQRLFLQEIDLLKKKLQNITEENNSLSLKVQSLEKERLEHDEALSKSKSEINSQNEEISRLKNQISDMQDLRAQLNTEHERLIAKDTEVERVQKNNSELTQDMATCRAREAELLDFTQKLTAKNVRLQSEFSALEAKAEMLEKDVIPLNLKIKELESEISNLKLSLESEKQSKDQDNKMLARVVAEKTKQLEAALQEIEELKSENQIMKRKHASTVRELNKELSTLKKKLESCNSDVMNDNQTLGYGSRASSCTSLNENQHSPTSASISSTLSSTLQLEPDRSVLIERIVELQRSHAKTIEKMEFLEEHNAQLINELQKKTKIIQNYIVREQTGALSSRTMDVNKAEFSKYGGIMASLYSSKHVDDSITLELSLEINRKLQAVLEDTILKNITLKENIDTLGEQIERLSKKS